MSEELDDLLLKDCTNMIAVILGYVEYVKSIGKENEAKLFVQNFIKELQQESIEKHLKKVS